MAFQFYCSHCGAPLPHVPPVNCGKCRVSHWRNPKPCAGALVTHQGQLMLTRRAIEPYRGMWDIPGGYSDFGEHPQQTARREVLEETGLIINITGLAGIWMDHYGPVEDEDLRVSTLNIYFHAVLGVDARQNQDHTEISEIGWFLPEELPKEMAFPHHEAIVLEAWKNDFLSGKTTCTLHGFGDCAAQNSKF
jgi:8-oxo-dGTP diphosphatase